MLVGAAAHDCLGIRRAGDPESLHDAQHLNACSPRPMSLCDPASRRHHRVAGRRNKERGVWRPQLQLHNLNDGSSFRCDIGIVQHLKAQAPIPPCFAYVRMSRSGGANKPPAFGRDSGDLPRSETHSRADSQFLHGARRDLGTDSLFRMDRRVHFRWHTQDRYDFRGVVHIPREGGSGCRIKDEFPKNGTTDSVRTWLAAKRPLLECPACSIPGLHRRDGLMLDLAIGQCLNLRRDYSRGIGNANCRKRRKRKSPQCHRSCASS